MTRRIKFNIVAAILLWIALLFVYLSFAQDLPIEAQVLVPLVSTTGALLISIWHLKRSAKRAGG